MTQQKNFQSMFSSDAVSKFMDSFQKMPFDLQGLMETQRKNWQTISEAQQKAVESFQAIALRQAELFSQALESQSSLASELMKEGKPEDKLAKNAEAIKSSYEKAMANAAEISEMVKKANAEAVGLLNKRVSASLKEVRSAIAHSEKDAA
jgi:phasin family protein